MASTASGRKGAKIQYDISWFYPNKLFFQNIKIKLNSNAWMTLKSSVVINQAWKPLQPQWPEWPQQPQFIKKILILMVWSSLAPKWSIPVPFCRLDHQKSIFSLISDILSIGGCWGQSILLFWKQMEETQMSTPSEATRHPNFK